jgi:HPt (histidine-containing phosphotransfer) domain-containing protein
MPKIAGCGMLCCMTDLAGMTDGDRPELLVDEAAVRALVSDIGDAQVVRSIVATWCELLPARLGAIAACRDAQAVAGAAHALASASLTVGASVLGEQARGIERAARADGRVPGDADLAALTQLAHRSEEALRRSMDANANQP